MTTYSPSPVQLGSITQPADGIRIQASDVNVPTAALADGVKFVDMQTAPLASLAALAAIATPADGTVRHILGFGLYVFKTSATTGLSPFRVAATDLTAGGWVSSTAHQTTITRIHVPAGLPNYLLSVGAPAVGGPGAPTNVTDISFGVGAFAFLTVVTGSSIAKGLVCGLDSVLVDGATLTLVRVRWVANNSHASLPNLMPKMYVDRIVFGSTNASLLSTGSGLSVDTSASAAAYITPHWNSFTPDQNNVIDKSTYSYSLGMFNEGGTNALTGAGAYAIEITQTIPDARRA